jgi:L-ascorbate metabolism protein UlaG (beta-lactamase superfamily)
MQAGRAVFGGLFVAVMGLLLWSPQAFAQASICHAVASSPPLLMQASFSAASLSASEVRITYVGHSAFRIESAEGVAIVTDYFGNSGEGPVPDIVTMNHAHETHYTAFPDPAIAHVLRGWGSQGEPARHRLQLRDVIVRNVPTDLYSGGFLIEENGNSIFVFEIAGLCIGHLGHLHHKLTPAHIAEIGRIDVLFMPVDGNYTMSQEGMIELAGQLRSSIVIPMHFFSNFSLQRFLDGMRDSFAIDLAGARQHVVSLANLPSEPTVLVLNPY